MSALTVNGDKVRKFAAAYRGSDAVMASALELIAAQADQIVELQTIVVNLGKRLSALESR